MNVNSNLKISQFINQSTTVKHPGLMGARKVEVEIASARKDRNGKDVEAKIKTFDFDKLIDKVGSEIDTASNIHEINTINRALDTIKDLHTNNQSDLTKLYYSFFPSDRDTKIDALQNKILVKKGEINAEIKADAKAGERKVGLERLPELEPRKAAREEAAQKPTTQEANPATREPKPATQERPETLKTEASIAIASDHSRVENPLEQLRLETKQLYSQVNLKKYADFEKEDLRSALKILMVVETRLSSGKPLSEEELQELKSQSDIGLQTAQKIIGEVEKRVDPEQLKNYSDQVARAFDQMSSQLRQSSVAERMTVIGAYSVIGTSYTELNGGHINFGVIGEPMTQERFEQLKTVIKSGITEFKEGMAKIQEQRNAPVDKETFDNASIERNKIIKKYDDFYQNSYDWEKRGMQPAYDGLVEATRALVQARVKAAEGKLTAAETKKIDDNFKDKASEMEKHFQIFDIKPYDRRPIEGAHLTKRFDNFVREAKNDFSKANAFYNSLPKENIFYADTKEMYTELKSLHEELPVLEKKVDEGVLQYVEFNRFTGAYFTAMEDFRERLRQEDQNFDTFLGG